MLALLTAGAGMLREFRGGFAQAWDALGIWTGHHLHLNLSRATVIRVMGGLLVVSGISLIVRALG